MDYPVIIDGENAGILRAEQRGLYTHFSARFPDPGRLLRICVYGGGKSALLGVAMPENGELVLERSFSRRAMESFPAEIEYAAPEGEEPKKSEPAPEPEPESREERNEEPELIWYSRPDGCLTTLWQGHSFVAVPLELCAGEREGMVEQRTIEGREYAVFEGQSVD